MRCGAPEKAPRPPACLLAALGAARGTSSGEGVWEEKQHHLACAGGAIPHVMAPHNPGLSKGSRTAYRTAGLADLGMAIDAETHSTQAGTMARCIGNVIYVLQACSETLCKPRAACGGPSPCRSETLSNAPLHAVTTLSADAVLVRSVCRTTPAHTPECLSISGQRRGAPQELGAYAAAVALQDVLRPPADSLYARLAARAPDFFDAADADDTSASDSDDEALCPSGLAGWCEIPAF